MIDIGTYYVIAAIRGLQEFKRQIKMDNLTDYDIGLIKLAEGSSILEVAISHRQYDLANYLLDVNVPVNIICAGNYNELHIISPHLHETEAVSIANRLLEKGVDLSLIENKYGNTAMFSVTLQVVTHPNKDNIDFLKKCLSMKSGIYEKNKSNLSVIDLLEEYQEIVHKSGSTLI